MRLLAVLDELADDGHAGGAQQLAQLGEVVALRHDADAERALLGAAAIGGWACGLAVRPLRWLPSSI